MTPATFTEADIAAMLSKTPVPNDYTEWLKICSAVWSQLPAQEGARLLNAWNPERKGFSYLAKHKDRLQKVGIGTLVWLAKQNGWEPRRVCHPPAKVSFKPTPKRTARNSHPSWLPPMQSALKDAPLPELSLTPPSAIEKNALPTHVSKEPVAMSVATSPQDIEAHRMVAELMKLHKLGVISGADDPDARFFAKVIHQFNGTIQKQPQIAELANLHPSNKNPYSELVAQRNYISMSNSVNETTHQPDSGFFVSREA